jgi:hypothetical protein
LSEQKDQTEGGGSGYIEERSAPDVETEDGPGGVPTKDQRTMYETEDEELA